MLKNFLTTAAAGALLFGATATYADDATKPMDTTTAPATMEDSNSSGAMDTAKPATMDSAASTTATDATTTTASAGYLTQQSPDQISANTYIGQPVYNANNDNVGDINDLILKKDGGIVAAIIGVGGFLGIGEKNVAVPIENIAVAQNADGSDMTLKLTTTETADSLKQAPEFKTLAMQSAERNRANDTMMDSTTTSSTTPNAAVPNTTAPTEPAPAPAATDTQPAQ